MMCVSHRMILSPPALSISDVILQMPGLAYFSAVARPFSPHLRLLDRWSTPEMAQWRVKKLPDPDQDLLEGGGANY